MKAHKIEFIETKQFLNDLFSILHKGQNDEVLRNEIKSTICTNPLIGTVIPRSGGVRKLRYAAPGKGKSGGYRVIYYFYDAKHPVFLLTIYAKSKTENLTQKETKTLFDFVKQVKARFTK